MAETFGSLIDKVTIVELKIYHMAEQVARGDIEAVQRRMFEDRLEILRRQRDDLAAELTRLVRDVAAGRVVPTVYRQFKMYNDPAYRAPNPESHSR